MIDQTLRYHIKGSVPAEDADPRIVLLGKGLTHIRRARSEVSDDIWIAAARKVDELVQLHSSLTPGEKSYLQFVEGYVP
jgi:hypothetical protein